MTMCLKANPISAHTQCFFVLFVLYTGFDDLQLFIQQQCSEIDIFIYIYIYLFVILYLYVYNVFTILLEVAIKSVAKIFFTMVSK